MAPLVVARERGRSCVYPMELLRVKLQRVSIPQMTSDQQARTTRECAVLPLMRENNIVKCVKAQHITTEDNPYISNAGIRIISQPLMVCFGFLFKTRMYFSAMVVFFLVPVFLTMAELRFQSKKENGVPEDRTFSQLVAKFGQYTSSMEEMWR